MKSFVAATLLLCASFACAIEPLQAEFAQRYFKAMVATQLPGAQPADVEAYLNLLTDDVGYTHLPHVTDDSRLPEGKAQMREGMTFYLGAHTHYAAKLLDAYTFNDSAVAIRYTHTARGLRPDTKEPVAYTQVVMEVLELESGKVAVIRKYHE